MKNSLSPRTMLIGLVVGVFSVPALVFAASGFFATHSDAPAAQAQTPAVAAPFLPAPTTSAAPTTTVAPSPTAADVVRACGEDGLSLVAAETDGSISELEQAALDALRPICEAEGLPLPGAAAPEPVTVVETVLLPPATSPVAPGGGVADHDDAGDHDEDDEHEDDEHEDDD